MSVPSAAEAAKESLSAPLPFPFELRRVLDIQNRRVVDCAVDPSDAGLTCDVLIVGGGVGGVAAALAAAKAGLSVVITEPTSMLGGQLTSQLVPAPDENQYIEKEPGPSTASYRALRTALRARVSTLPGIKPGKEVNLGDCWVSRVSAPPHLWDATISEQLAPFMNTGQIRRVFLRHQLRSAQNFSGNGQFNFADFVDLDTGKVRRIGAKFLLDATEDGCAMLLAGQKTRLGQEAKGEFGESHAPETAHPEWIQSFTYCFLLRMNGSDSPVSVVAPPAEYANFNSWGEYTLGYIYRGQSPEPFEVPYKVFVPTMAPTPLGEKRYLPFWTYRRLQASSNFQGGTSPIGDIALINWRGNDFHDESYLDKPLDEQARILERGRAFAEGFCHWLQTECPRDDGGFGYPEMRLLTSSEQPGVGADGFALHPYIRESRRLVAKFTLNENHLLSADAGARWGEAFFDSVGCAAYSIDIHPSREEPPLLVPCLPYHLPLGAFLSASGPKNVLPAAKNFGATRLALASARMHPTEWLAGEVSGTLAAFCIERGLSDPSLIRAEPDLLAAFQARLRSGGATLYWSEILPPTTPQEAPERTR